MVLQNVLYFCLWLKILVRIKLPLMLYWIIAWSLRVPVSKMVNQVKILSVKFNCTTFDLWKKQVIYSQIWICYYMTFAANVIKHKNGDDVQTAAFYDCHIFYSAKGILTRWLMDLSFLCNTPDLITKMYEELQQISVCCWYWRTRCWFWSNNWRYSMSTYSNWEALPFHQSIVF